MSCHDVQCPIGDVWGSGKQTGLLLRMRFKEEQFSQKTIPKLVRTRERSTASWAPLQVVVD